MNLTPEELAIEARANDRIKCAVAGTHEHVLAENVLDLNIEQQIKTLDPETDWKQIAFSTKSAAAFYCEGWRDACGKAAALAQAAVAERDREIERLRKVIGVTMDSGVAVFKGAESLRALADQQAAKLTALEAENANLRTRLLSAAGDDLCRLTQEEIKAYTDGSVKIPPKGEFIASCERFHEQIASESGVMTNCLTLAQLIAENTIHEAEIKLLRSRNTILEAELTRLRNTLAELPAKVRAAYMGHDGSPGESAEFAFETLEREITKPAEAAKPCVLELLREARDELARFVVVMEYDCPGDTPEPCGMCCELCHATESSGLMHKPDCLLARIDAVLKGADHA